MTVTFTGEAGEGQALLHTCLADVAKCIKKEGTLFCTCESTDEYGAGGAHYNLMPQGDNKIALKSYRHVGRLLGLALLCDCRLPILFYRHVYKFLLDRPVS